MKIYILLILSIVFSSSHGNACSCSWGGPFYEMANKSNLVVKVKVLSYGKKLKYGENLYSNMEVEIIDVIKGKFKNKKMVVLGDPGHLCRPYISTDRFPLKKVFLLALAENMTSTQALSVCGEFYIRVEKDKAFGSRLAGNEFQKYTVPLKDLLSEIK